MANLEKVLGVSWRVWQRLTEAQKQRLAEAAFTRQQDRSSDQQDAIEHVQELEAKTQRRMDGVNALGCGRVNGQPVVNGQPRGKGRRG